MRIAKNRAVDALLKFMLCCAIFHIILLMAMVIIKGDVSYLNLFDILELDLLFPSIAQGAISQVLSLVSIAAIYLVIYFFFTKK